MWRAHVDSTTAWMRRRIEVYMVQQFQDGAQEYPINWGDRDPSSGIMNLPTMYRATNPNVATDPAAPQPMPLVLDEEAAKALMEELQRHFGAYAGVDYERLRKDYDRVAAELATANEHIRKTMTSIIEGRKATPPK